VDSKAYGQHLSRVDDEIRRLQALGSEVRAMLTELEECPKPTVGEWWCESEFTRRGGEPDGL
jgi:hypothetical protein